MKIIFLGLTLSSSWGNGHATPCRAIIRALHDLGHRVAFYEKELPYYARRRDFSSCSYCRLELYSDWDQVRHRALPEIDSADVVVLTSYCPEGSRIADDVLAINRPLRVFYDMDTPITIEKLRNESVDYLRRDQIPAFDLYLSFTGGPILGELEQMWGARRARPLFGCVDPDAYAKVEPRNDWKCLLSYMGTYSADRQDKVESLFLAPARNLPALRFILAGSMYPAHISTPPNVSVVEHVAPAEHPALYSSSRLTLNITRRGMALYGFCPSGRFFEAAACSAPIISDWFPGIESFFIPGEEVFIVHSTSDVCDVLSASDADLSRVAARCRERTLAEHSGARRVRELLAFCEEARAAKSFSELRRSGVPASSLSSQPATETARDPFPGGVS